MLKVYHSLHKQTKIWLSKAHREINTRNKGHLEKSQCSTNFLIRLQQDEGGGSWLKQQRKTLLGLVCLGKLPGEWYIPVHKTQEVGVNHWKLMMEKTEFKPFQYQRPEVPNTKPTWVFTSRPGPSRVLVSTEKPPKITFFRDKRTEAKYQKSGPDLKNKTSLKQVFLAWIRQVPFSILNI